MSVYRTWTFALDGAPGDVECQVEVSSPFPGAVFSGTVECVSKYGVRVYRETILGAWVGNRWVGRYQFMGLVGPAEDYTVKVTIYGHYLYLRFVDVKAKTWNSASAPPPGAGDPRTDLPRPPAPPDAPWLGLAGGVMALVVLGGLFLALKFIK